MTLPPGRNDAGPTARLAARGRMPLPSVRTPGTPLPVATVSPGAHQPDDLDASPKRGRRRAGAPSRRRTLAAMLAMFEVAAKVGELGVGRDELASVDELPTHEEDLPALPALVRDLDAYTDDCVKLIRRIPSEVRCAIVAGHHVVRHQVRRLAPLLAAAADHSPGMVARSMWSLAEGAAAPAWASDDFQTVWAEIATRMRALDGLVYGLWDLLAQRRIRSFNPIVRQERNALWRELPSFMTGPSVARLVARLSAIEDAAPGVSREVATLRLFLLLKGMGPEHWGAMSQDDLLELLMSSDLAVRDVVMTEGLAQTAPLVVTHSPEGLVVRRRTDGRR